MDHETRKWVRDSLHHLNFLNGSARPLGLRNCNGMTLIELLITISIVATLAGIAAPIFGTYIDKARSQKAVSDIRTTLQAGITLYEFANDTLPMSLTEISRGGILDPWGKTYQYLNLAAAGPGWQGQARKDQLFNPLNTDYDLYSMGENGRSAKPLNNRWARDDIVRANEGAYIGLASDF
jgi:general secretion pathway protein G